MTMAKILVQSPYAIVSCGLKAIAMTLKDEEVESSVLDVSSDKKSHIITWDLSGSGKFLVLCLDNKIVSLWETCTWTLLSNRYSARVASKVKFVPSEESIILADKPGDVYEFSVKHPQEDGKLLLGHLSMLLDVLVTPDGKWVITCDRDEKIRVSSYPNAYNIQSYCLGHKEFVTNIFLLPHEKSILVSSSGDGTLRLWDYVSGIELHLIDTTNHDFIKECIKDHDNTPAIRLASSCLQDASASLICCCLSNVQLCLIYQVTGSSHDVTHKLIQVLRPPAEPWDIFLIENQLWIIGPVSEKPLSVFTWDSQTQQFLPCIEKSILSLVSKVNSRWDMFKNIAPASQLTVLYKRKFDNVQEHPELKKQRLAGTIPALAEDMLY